MPLSKGVLIWDEVKVWGDPNLGHIFTMHYTSDGLTFTLYIASTNSFLLSYPSR